MKRLAIILVLTGLAAVHVPAAWAQSSPPALPQLDAGKSAEVQRQLSLYRTEIDGRVARGELSADEASRLLAWREWQLAQQAAGLAPPPGPILETAPVREYYYRPAPPPVYYGPAYAVPYYAPWPYYWGPRVCAGGWGRHFGGRFCI